MFNERNQKSKIETLKHKNLTKFKIILKFQLILGLLTVMMTTEQFQ